MIFKLQVERVIICPAGGWRTHSDTHLRSQATLPHAEGPHHQSLVGGAQWGHQVNTTEHPSGPLGGTSDSSPHIIDRERQSGILC